MRIFLSYPSQDRALVEPIYLALRTQGHSVFFDRTDLLPGDEYDMRIRQAIEKADLLIFMLSPDALDAGSYTLTELEIAQKTWELPSGRVLPVMLRPVALDQVPPYLKSVTFLQPDGNETATVADAVHRIALTRRKALLATLAKGLAVALAVGVGAYFWWTNRQPAAEKTGKDGAPATLVPAGTFTMGDNEESPQREVFLDAFYLDKYEVTTSRYGKFLRATGSVIAPDYWEDVGQDSGGDRPVIGVDWHDADGYCRWAGKRLPTDAEWEKAARGTDGRAYPWGNDEPTAARAHFGQPMIGPYTGLAAVGRHEAGKSPYGVEDLAGNASEWVADWFTEVFAPSDARNPKGPDNGPGRVIRGSGWHDPPSRLTSTKRYHASPDTRSDDIGFRCALDVR